MSGEGDHHDGDPGNVDPGDGDPGGGGVDDDEGRLQQYFSPAGGPALKAQPDQHCKLHTGQENTQMASGRFKLRSG